MQNKVVEKKNGKRDLTPQEMQAAKRLDAAFKSGKKRHGYTQETLGHRLGWSQAAVSQYMRGVNPIGLEALIAICSLIDADPREIYPEITGQLTFVTGESSDLLEKMSRLSPDNRALIATMIAAMLDRQ